MLSRGVEEVAVEVEIEEISVRVEEFSSTTAGRVWGGGEEVDETGGASTEVAQGATVVVATLVSASSGKTNTESSGAGTRRTSRLASKQKLARIASSEMAAARSAGSQRSR